MLVSPDIPRCHSRIGDEEAALCVGHETRNLWNSARDIFDTWMLEPERRAEFGDHETRDIAAVVLSLTVLLREIKGAKHG